MAQGVCAVRKPRRLLTVLDRDAIIRILLNMESRHGRVARLLYGFGMRLIECLRLRVKDVDPQRREILVHEALLREYRTGALIM